ncbi:hypothetical protein LIER_31999 [Lithospermum erythrorhizon]|uniref:RNase H type-1 domain-containing protein n=1 Tax=Lithospermum erythrorhizon TaxID=34254 RepID=A0AAV3RXZ5_LITER
MNLAMLAKQGWLIVTKQASLLFRILKGLYFRRSSFTRAKLGANPSFGWRSLLEGHKVLLKGLRWCGNYLTCSGYKCARTMKKNGELRTKACGEGSSCEGGQSTWREFWKLNCLRELGTFCGRVYMEQRDQPDRTNPTNESWRPPQLNFIKINIDAAWNKASSDGAIRVIGRDSAGNFVGVSYKRLQWVSSTLIAEAHALREGLPFAWRLNWRSMELESDSK